MKGEVLIVERSAPAGFLSKPGARILDGMPKPSRPLDPLRQMVHLHLEASLRRDALLEECQRLVIRSSHRIGAALEPRTSPG